MVEEIILGIIITVLCHLIWFNFLSSQKKLRKDQSSHYGPVLLISELPEDGCTEEDIRKIFQPFGKVNDVLIVPYRKEVSYLVCSKIHTKSLFYKDCCWIF